MKKWKILIPSLVATASMPLMGLVGCNKSKDPVAKDFTTDPWSTICFYANQGLEKLHEVYAHDCQKNNFMPGTLIGLERTTTINGETHHVMVIDENSDTYDKNGVDTPAALTFQFRTLISGGDQTYKGKKMALFINWDDDHTVGSGDYWNSSLYNALNGTDTRTNPVPWQNENESFADIHISVFQMINNENSDLADNIKLVKRTICSFTDVDGDGNPIWGNTNGSAKLFCPTISNYFSVEGISNSDSEVIITSEHLPFCLAEGQTNAEVKQYKYYAQDNRIGNTIIGQNLNTEAPVKSTFNCVIVRDAAGSAPKPTSETYWSWVGSPWLENDVITNKGEPGECCGTISPNGCFCNYGDINDFNAIAPCFCI